MIRPVKTFSFRILAAVMGAWAAGSGISLAGEGKEGGAHWAFQPVVKPAAPAVGDASRVSQPLDAFVIAGLEKKGLALAPAADRPTLIRRAHFNLIGVPPTAEEVDAFVADPDPQAFTALVDRLLADPRFGERWGRYWLDVARYADSKGYVFQEERRYAYSYTYRDWVIQSFNEDLPYDKFVLAQLAADQTLGKEDPRHLAAMGFLTLGRRFLNNQADIIDDRLDVTFRGLQAVTISCARCHDHKFDPIPTADYYSLYGVFASSEEPQEKPLLGEPERTPEYLAFEAELKKREQAVDEWFAKKKQSLFEEAALEKYLALIAEGWGKNDEELRTLAREKQLYPSIAVRWRKHFRDLGGGHPVAAPYLALVNLTPENFEAGRDSALQAVAATASVNSKVTEALRDAAPKSMAEVAKTYARVFAQAKAAPPASEGEDSEAAADAENEVLRQVLDASEGLGGVDTTKMMRDFSVAEAGEVRGLRNEIDNYKATAENGPARAMAMVDKAEPVQPVIFKRGSPGARGEEVPRQFLGMLAGPERKPFASGSGRLELAQTIASPANPLTARVFANRVWAWLVGAPLVETPSDFGVRTAPPANPEVLEYLAASLLENGWSMKKLIREIMLSAAWQQSSDVDGAQAEAADPENHLLWKMNRRRRDFESFRDSLLSVSGRLDPQRGGRPVSIDRPEDARRTIYGFIDRQNLPGLFRAFDFASPDQHAPKRFQTTVPQQALFALNNPFVVTQARALAALPASAPEARIDQIFRRVLSRHAEPAEIEESLVFAAQTPMSQTAGAWEYGYGDLDAATGQTRFFPMPSFAKDTWSGSENVPDATLGWALVNRSGGHPGAGPDRAVIWRWRSPAAGPVSLRGELHRPSENGDGVRLRLVTDKKGLVREWDIAASGKADLETSLSLEMDEVVDLVVDAKESDNSDSFNLKATFASASGQLLADTAEEFAGPPVDPWIALAQVMLISNELMFVD